MDNNVPEDEPVEIAIAKLSGLDKIEYARQRKEAALRAGIPLKLLDDLVATARAERAQIDNRTIAGGGDLTEDSTARAFARAYAGQLVFDHTLQRWFIWTGARWRPDDKDAVFFLARDFCRELFEQADPRHPPVHVAKISFAGNVERAARSDPKLAVTHEIWDRDPWLLGVPGGVIDLRTGGILAPDATRYISREASVPPAPPGTDAPTWRAFLDEATGGDAEYQDFLQRLCGYFLTGLVNEEIIAFIYGAGGNGKGTFLRPVSQIMADYTASLPIEVFTINGRINLEYYRAQMAGRRMITTVEPENGAEWSESTIKELSGNETALSARHPYGRPFEFYPVCKMIGVGNHAPKLKGRTPAMERRLRVCPFNNVPRVVDKTLKDRLVAEYPAIFRWMIDGALMWQRGGLGTCAAVRAASAAYFEGQDSFRMWLEECCVLDPSLSTKPGLLLAAFNAWTRANGREAIDAVAFAETVDRTPGFSRGKWNGVRLVRGVGLKDEPGSRASGEFSH